MKTVKAQKGARTPSSFLFEEQLKQIDPDIAKLISLEQQRQSQKLQMIASESICPPAVLIALASPFANKYAEGYPLRRFSIYERSEETDIERQVAFHKRYGDRRYYKGNDYVNVIETMAQKRVAELFANDIVSAREIFPNVQSLSGAAANNAVYEAILKPGDSIMGLSLAQGGHLTHGSPYNRSGKIYRVTGYSVNTDTGRLDYDLIEKLALENKPRLIIGGASSYPWEFDWKALRAIADKAGAFLMADIAHTAGLVVGGVYPNPVGYADVVTFTTHKSLCGPRGAVILTTDFNLSKKIDSAVFPGEQGGPHIHQIAAKAVAFKLAGTEKFKQLMHAVVDNAKALAQAFTDLGFELAYGGTASHLVLIDLKTLKKKPMLTGDVASNILDSCRLVCNKNVLPGDDSGVRPTGLRFGTVILSQRGMGGDEMKKVAEIVKEVLDAIETFKIESYSGRICRGRVQWSLIKKVREEVERLTTKFPPFRDGARVAAAKIAISIRGERSPSFVNQATSLDVFSMTEGETRKANVYYPDGRLVDAVHVTKVNGGFRLTCERLETINWLNSLSDGYVYVKPEDPAAKVDGPVCIESTGFGNARASKNGAAVTKAEVAALKPFYVGRKQGKPDSLPEFKWQPKEEQLKATSLYEFHKANKAHLVPFGGYSMPVWFTNALEEHNAVRSSAGLFDVGHMGTLEVSGPNAEEFLNLVMTNFVYLLKPGHSQYSYILDVNGGVLDDLIIYRISREKFNVVVNASNQDKVWDWLSGINEGKYRLAKNDTVRIPRTYLRRLKDKECGDERLIDTALQGRRAKEVLSKLIPESDIPRLRTLGKFQHFATSCRNINVLVSRTGYTGEDIGYEIFVHPDAAVDLFKMILEFDVKLTGLAARDSTRCEAGFPLYGHELAGRHNVTPTEAGYGSFVKLHKPFFVGRDAYTTNQKNSKMRIARFSIEGKARAVRSDDPVLNSEGRCVGFVTSCVQLESRQVGMAYVQYEFGREGTAISIYPLPRTEHTKEVKPVTSLQIGDRFLPQISAKVISRFQLFGL